MRVWILYLFLIAAITISLLAWFCDKLPGDEAVMKWVQTCDDSVFVDCSETISLFGQSWLLISLAGFVAIGLFIIKRPREGFVAVGALILKLVAPLMKDLIDRPRPPADMVMAADSFGEAGFPSGHAYQSLILFGFLIWLVPTFVSRKWVCRSIQVMLGLLIAAIGFSRIHLGAHWPSDVLGSYIIGGFFLSLLIWAYHKKGLPQRFRRKS